MGMMRRVVFRSRIVKTPACAWQTGVGSGGESDRPNRLRVEAGVGAFDRHLVGREVLESDRDPVRKVTDEEPGEVRRVPAVHPLEVLRVGRVETALPRGFEQCPFRSVPPCGELRVELLTTDSLRATVPNE